MDVELLVRTDIEAAELRRLARREGEGRVAVRLLTIADVLDGTPPSSSRNRRHEPSDAARPRGPLQRRGHRSFC